jgi:CheY-like chemotaxis protein
MSQIERGIKNATLNSIARISTALEVVPSVLLSLTEEIGREGDKALESAIVAYGAQKLGANTRVVMRKGDAPILLVDDDSDILAAVDSILTDAGYETRRASCGFDAFWIVSNEPVRAVVSDIRMANGNGIELCEAMRRHFPNVPLLFMTGFDDVTAEEAMRRGAKGILSKPFEMSELLALMKTTVNNGLTA